MGYIELTIIVLFDKMKLEYCFAIKEIEIRRQILNPLSAKKPCGNIIGIVDTSLIEYK